MDGSRTEIREEHFHHHDHGHGHHEHTDERVSVHVHEGAVVGTVKTDMICPLDAALKEMRKKFAEIAETIEAAGGYIGHIKGMIEEDGRKCRISVVEAEGRIDTEILPAAGICHVECVFIVFSLTPDTLKGMLEKKFSPE